jgi:oligopeptide transport system substrate-binding protein
MPYRSPRIDLKHGYMWRMWCKPSTPSNLPILFSLLLLLAACTKSGTLIGNGTPAATQVLTIPLIGVTNAPSFDPTVELDANGQIMMNMLYSGLVRTDKNLQVIPDQASWDISSNQKIYTFHLKSGLTFADGTAVTAKTYIASWIYAFRSTNVSPQIVAEAYNIVGARQIHTGKSKTLSGVRALDTHTLQVTLIQPAPYFLAQLANPLFFPINQKLLASVQGETWPVSVAQQGVGTGPFIVKDFVPGIKMSLLPNPHYYGNKLTLTQVNVSFQNDPRVAYIANRNSNYDLIWNLVQDDQLAANQLSGFTSAELLQTDALFFNTTQAPFNSVAVRQAFAAAIDKQTYAQTTMENTALPAGTMWPSNMSCYPYHKASDPQSSVTEYNTAQARALLKSAYPDQSSLPSITFSYPVGQMTPAMATALQHMWQTLPGIKINVQPLDLFSYQQELKNHTLQFGLISWQARFADPYAFAEPFLSTSSQNVAQWHSADYDRLITQADATTGDARLSLYSQAEQLLLKEAPVIPLDHQCMAGLIPNWIEGVAINAQGLYFGDWSAVKILSHT